MKITGRIIGLEKMRQLITFPRFLIIMSLIGIIMRVVTIFTDMPKFDGAGYAALGYNFSTKHDFVALEGVHAYSGSLTYPVYLAIFYTVFGFSIPVTQFASILVSIAILIVAYYTTANLMGKEKALIVTAVLALLQPLIISAGKNYVENMVLLFFIPAIWAMLKSFKDSRYIILASFFAGLVYYTKSDVGFPMVIGGMAAYAIWRFYHMRWELLKDKNYYVAFIILFVMVVVRSYFIYTAEPGVSTVSGGGLARLSSFEGVLKFLAQSIFHAILIGGFIIFWAPEFRRSILEIRKENGILLLSALALMIPIIIHASGSPLFSTEPIERVSRAYITIVYVPFLWLFLLNKNLDEIPSKTNKLMVMVSNLIVSVFRERKKLLLLLVGLLLAGISALIDDYLPLLYFFGAFALVIVPIRKRVVLLLIAFLILSANALTYQYIPAYVDIADEVNERLEKGDVIALARIEGSRRISPSAIYLYFSERDITIKFYNDTNTTDARFIISESNETFYDYELIGIYYGTVKPSILKSIAMNVLGREDRYQQPPLYLWERS